MEIWKLDFQIFLSAAVDPALATSLLRYERTSNMDGSILFLRALCLHKGVLSDLVVSTVPVVVVVVVVVHTQTLSLGV